MKNNTKGSLLIGAVGVCGFLAWFMTPKDTSVHVSSAVEVLKQPSSVTATPSNQAPAMSLNVPHAVPASEAEVAFKDNARFIATAYASELQYPVYSRPLSKNDFDRLEPNFFANEVVPINDDGEKLTLSLEKYRYTAPEPIVLTLMGRGITRASVAAQAVGGDDVLASSKFSESNGLWQATVLPNDNFPMSLELVINARVQGKTIPVVAHVKYVKPTATIIKVEQPTTRDSDMAFNVVLDVKTSGLYRVKANLFSQDGRPIAHLTGKDKLSSGRQSLVLNAHVSVLKGETAPFVLRTFQVELMSPRPEMPKQYGNRNLDELVIDDFAVESLVDKPYEPSEQEQQRLQFLQTIAN